MDMIMQPWGCNLVLETSWITTLHTHTLGGFIYLFIYFYLLEIFPSLTVKFHLAIVTWQLKEKRRQLFLKTTSEGRQRAKQKRFESELERERKNQQDEEKRLYVPNLGIYFKVICCGQI